MTEEIDGSPVTEYLDTFDGSQAMTEDGRTWKWVATRTPETEGPDYGEWVEMR